MRETRIGALIFGGPLEVSCSLALMLRLPDSWVWDSWYVDDGERFHAFYLKASRALGDPDRRHHRPAVGHAVSMDLTEWHQLADALVCDDPPAFDDQGIWTGSIVRADDGRWHLFYTGIDRITVSGIQRIGHAVSDDLLSWQRLGLPPIEADGRWYEKHERDGREAWRDPWVFRDGGRWRMLVTAGSIRGPQQARGCIGTAVSEDLMSWAIEPPLAQNVGLHQMEVLQTLEVDGSYVVVFCMCSRDVFLEGLPHVTGTWSAPADSLSGPFHIDRAEPIAVDGNYAGRVVLDRRGVPHLMAFVDVDHDGAFGGYLGDPVPLRLTGQGTLQPVAANATKVFKGRL